MDPIDRIARHAEERPDATAIVASGRRVSYRALAADVHRLARHLRAAGVGPETLVCLCLPRGLEEVTAMLAVLAAGGAYLPVDPAHPPERLRVVLEDGRAALALTSQALAGTLAGAPIPRVMRLDQERWAAERLDASPLALPVAPDQLAYVLFTSGSTGRPKGVEIGRGAVANLLGAMAREPGLSAADRLLAITTSTFDISVLELFLPLCLGATVEIAERETASDPARLRRVLERADQRITVMQATPATWRRLVAAGWRGDGQLRVLCGGEAMTPELARDLLARAGEVWNVYGPTETTVWSTVARVQPGAARVPIGRPIDRTRVYVLDESGAEVASGDVGELWIGGAGVARGYRGQPARTAERFVPDPRAPGERMYRTGDLGRRLPDGALEWLGRVDHQVKVRGHRIELGEIEAVLRATPGVDEVVVAARPVAEGEAELVAYWTGAATDPGELAERARAGLPHYMQPHAFVHLPAFPLNSNGKVDRGRLPDAAAAAARPRRAPRTDVEARLAQIWRELLGVAAIGVDDDFFALGGTSARAVEAVERIHRELGVELPVHALFRWPTVADLAASLQAPTPATPVVLTLRDGDPGGPALFCLHGLQLYQDIAAAVPADWRVVAMHVPLPRRERAELDIPSIAARYVALIREQRPHGPYDLAGLCFAGVVAFEAARQLEAAGEQVRAVVLFDAVLPRAEDFAPDRAARELARRLRESPRELAGQVWHAVARRVRPANGNAGGAELTVTGPDADALIAAYDSHLHDIGAKLLVVRALNEDTAPWRRRAPDLGWGGLGSLVRVCELPASHLDVMRAPHVEAVAAALAELTRS